MKRLCTVLVLCALFVVAAGTLPASAAIHPIVCSIHNASANAVGSPTGSIADPPGLTPTGVFFGQPHEDPLGAADGIADFRPLLAHLSQENGLALAHAWKGEGDCGG